MFFPSYYYSHFQAELRLTDYHKLARKLKLIPLSAENACGHDFEIRPYECGPGSMVQHKSQIQVHCWYIICCFFFLLHLIHGLFPFCDLRCMLQMLLRKLVSDVEEENSRLANVKLSLEETCEQVTETQIFQQTVNKLILV